MDDVPDLLFTNFKMTDIAGHFFGLGSQEMGDDVAAQDAALQDIVSYLEDHVREYVVIVTADHGHTPQAHAGGAWPISLEELRADLDRAFGITGDSLLQNFHAVGLFIDRAVATRAGVSLN